MPKVFPVGSIATNGVQAMYDVLFHTGLTKYKTVGSQASLPARVKAARTDKKSHKGAIFVVRNKADFTSHGVKGYIVTSKETLLEDAAGLSHFTPNVYKKYRYVDASRQFISGFEEKNLLQINTFVVDIDTKKYSLNDLLIACLDHSIGLPTWVIASTRGYQLYFVLREPLFISAKNNYRALRVAKRIALQLKESLASVEADVLCNDFGFFRLPTADNVMYMQLDNTYPIATLINWSMQRDNDKKRPLFTVVKKDSAPITMQADWFQALIHAADIQGEKGMLGRNNTVFTLALICLQAGWEEERTANFLEEFNARLKQPLPAGEMETTIRSAFSGKYEGPSKRYIEALLSLHVPNGDQYKVYLGKPIWYKFKKPREERTRSHYREWEQDIVKYITVQTSTEAPFIWHTQKQLCEALHIPMSTLNEVIKQSKELLIIRKGKGRGAKTGWTTVALYVQFAQKKAEQIAEQKGQARLDLQELLQGIPSVAAIAGYASFMLEMKRVLACVPIRSG